MRKGLILLLLIANPAVGALAQTGERPSKQQQTARPALSPRDIVERVSRSLVLIITQDPDGEMIAQGSGFCLEGDLVATNLHVFKQASKAYVKRITTGISQNIDDIVGMDVEHDLCVFRAPTISCSPLPLAAMTTLAVGDEVYAGGNPRGLEGSFSKGIISGLRLEQGVIQMDAAISPGSSGGPIVNTRAEVVGIAVSTLHGGQNLNFAVPVSYLDKLPLRLKQGPVDLAGAFALTDRDKDKLQGPVRTMTERLAYYDYSPRSDRDVEGPARLLEVKKYDRAGNLSEGSFYDTEREVLYWKVRFEYNPQGLQTRRIDLHSGEQETSKAVSFEDAFNEKGYGRFSTTLTRELTDPATGKKYTFSTDKYDRFGNLTETVQNPPARPTRRTVFVYNKSGFKEDERVYQNGVLESSRKYEYQLDEWGNWVRCYEQLLLSKFKVPGFIPSSVTYREITYYPN